MDGSINWRLISRIFDAYSNLATFAIIIARLLINKEPLSYFELSILISVGIGLLCGIISDISGNDKQSN